MSTEPTDEELLVGGGPEGFAVLYQRRHPLLRAYLRRRLGAQPDLVLDLVAEAFARALERRDQFDPGRGSASGWLIGIARHLLLDAHRRGQVADDSRRRLGMQRILVEDRQLERIEADGGSELERALQSLPPEQREAVRRRVLEDQPYAAIAARIGCSEQVVRKRVSRGLAALRQQIKESA